MTGTNKITIGDQSYLIFGQLVDTTTSGGCILHNAGTAGLEINLYVCSGSGIISNSSAVCLNIEMFSAGITGAGVGFSVGNASSSAPGKMTIDLSNATVGGTGVFAKTGTTYGVLNVYAQTINQTSTGYLFTMTSANSTFNISANTIVSGTGTLYDITQSTNTLIIDAGSITGTGTSTAGTVTVGLTPTKFSISQCFIASATQPYLSYATGDSNTVACAFMYPGTTYYGSSLIKWTVIMSNTVNSSLSYTLTLKDITNNNSIATLTASSVAVNATPAMISTTSFSNVNASAAIYEIQVTVSGSSSSFNMYSSNLEVC